MSEFVIFVETITGAGWLFLCGVAVVAVGFLTLDRHAAEKPKVQDTVRPGEQRAA